MKSISWSLKLIPVIIMAASCATTPTNKIALTGDVLVDGPKEIELGPPKDRVLWEYRTAAAAMRRGRFDLAKQYFDDALRRLEGAYGKDAEARKARGYFSKEARKTFIGEPYERSMAYIYRGFLYWMDGELDNARACLRSAEFEDSDAEKKQFAGDWILPDYLDGLASTKLGDDGSDAIKRAQARIERVRLPSPDAQANCFVFMEFGPGPTKYATGKYHEQLRIRTAVSTVKSARIKVDTLDIPVAPTDDVNFQATTRGGRVMDHILGNKAVFKSATATAGTAAIAAGLATAALAKDNTTREVGLGVAAAGVITSIVSAATTPEADTRTWDNLPQFLSFAVFPLSLGQHTATIEFLDGSGQAVANLTKAITINVASLDHYKVVFVSDSSLTPQTL